MIYILGVGRIETCISLCDIEKEKIKAHLKGHKTKGLP